MKKTNLFFLGVIAIALFLSSCGNNSDKKAEQKDSTTVKVENTTTAEVNYTGTYNIVDKSVCELTIVLQKNGNDLTYKCGTSEGKVDIIKQDAEVYLNLVAINGMSPKGDVEAKYENETLLIQNEGNSMNQYTNFKKCDAKYLELKKAK